MGSPPAIITLLRSGKSLNTKVTFSSISYILPNIAHKSVKYLKWEKWVTHAEQFLDYNQTLINYRAERQEDRLTEGAKLMPFVFDTSYFKLISK